MHDGKKEKIRLYGIDTPEIKQAFGNEAKNFVLTKELTGFLKQVINVGCFSEHVFCHKNGQSLKSFDSGFKAVLKRAGINNFRFHDLRHTF
jgi:integrase